MARGGDLKEENKVNDSERVWACEKECICI